MSVTPAVQRCIDRISEKQFTYPFTHTGFSYCRIVWVLILPPPSPFLSSLSAIIHLSVALITIIIIVIITVYEFGAYYLLLLSVERKEKNDEREPEKNRTTTAILFGNVGRRWRQRLQEDKQREKERERSKKKMDIERVGKWERGRVKGTERWEQWENKGEMVR